MYDSENGVQNFLQKEVGKGNRIIKVDGGANISLNDPYFLETVRSIGQKMGFVPLFFFWGYNMEIILI